MRIATLFLAVASMLTLSNGQVRRDVAGEEIPHPMLYFSQDDIPNLLHKASYTQDKVVAYIEEAANTIKIDQVRHLPPESHKVFSSNWNERYGNNLCMLSMYCVLYPDDDSIFQLLVKYMDRMTSYPDWYVESSRGRDQVPIGHSLTGYATAYDFLYRRFSLKQRDLYYQKLKNTTLDLYRLFQIGKAEWARQYIHNHSPSNLVAFLLGALVVSKHEKNLAEHWLEKVQKNLDFSMEIFSYIIDGSVDEGVSYGSYTSRGMTQYVYLAKRHFGVDHSNNPWLKEHFWFYYHTILPGYQRTVGIGDTNYHWFYGPESQLHLLDSFALHTGYGNWLADKIRSSRSRVKPLAQSTAQIWSTYHTEFLFYDQSISPVMPTGVKKMHIFSDWGVVTYGGCQKMKVGNTFLSFKSGIPNGEAVQDIMQSNRYPGWINGWKSFNAGHEHPDQNSFVFVPNGRYVVSESLYGPKMTYLDNTVVFAPSSTSRCNQPWEGQIGECDKWLGYRLYDENMRGEILTATNSGEMVFMAGEAVGVYSKSLKLSSVFRGILLLNPEVLIIVDTIRRYKESTTTKASFLFHNTWKKFKAYDQLGFKGAKVEYPEGIYSVITIPPTNAKVNITLHDGVKPAGLREGPTNFVNVTTPLVGQVTNLVHVFSGPNYRIKSLQMDPVSAVSGVSLTLQINDENYSVKIATAVKSRSKQFEPIRERKRITGFAGFAFVKHTYTSGEDTHYFGLDRASYNNGYGPLNKPYLSINQLHLHDLRKLPSRVRYTTSFDIDAESTVPTRETPVIYDEANRSVVSEPDLDVLQAKQSATLLIGQSAIFVAVVVGLTLAVRKFAVRSKGNIQFRQTSWHIPCVLSISMLLINSYCFDENGMNFCTPHYFNGKTMITPSSYHAAAIPRVSDLVSSAYKLTIPAMPFVMLTSLPGSGGYLLEKAFEDSSTLSYLPTRDLNIPVESGNSRDIDLCLWESEKTQHRFNTVGWFNSLKTKSILHFNQQRNTDEATDSLRRTVRENLNAPIVMNDDCGFWTTKQPWVRNVIGKENFQSVIVVRDPRSWIHAMIKSNSQERSDSYVKDLVNHIEKVDDSCTRPGSNPPYYHKHFKGNPFRRKYDQVEKLAMLWTVTVGSALANMAADIEESWPTHVIRFEDIMNDPEKATTDMFAKLGLPLSVKSLNNVVRTVKSGHYNSPHDGAIDSSLLTSWKYGLSITDIRKIERICGGLFPILGYKPLTQIHVSR